MLATPFPPDDRSIGYEREIVGLEGVGQATTDGAIEVADAVVSHLRELSGGQENDPDRKARLRDFCLKFAERAFRRPLTDRAA